MSKKYEEDPLLSGEAAYIQVNEERHKRKQRSRFIVALVIGLVVIGGLVGVLYYVSTLGNGIPPSSSVLGKYRHAAVAADAEQCSTVGRKMLEDHGGSAVDGAIATLLCLGLCSAHSMGIGGGFFMTIYDRESGNVTIVDAREVAPLAANKTMYEHDPKLSETGGLSIAVPGEIMGYFEAHQRFGNLPWKDLFQPVIKMAEEGFPVPMSLADAMEEDRKIIFNDPELKKAYVNPKTEDVYKENELLKLPKLAKTFKRIAADPQDYYTGTLAEEIIADIKDRDGIVTLEDLAQYKVLIKQALKSKLIRKDLEVYSPPPPSSGAVLMLMLNVLDGYDFNSNSIEGDEAAILTYHRIVEAYKFGYADRTFLGDEAFDANITRLANLMINHTYADHIRSRITDRTHNVSYYGPDFYDSVKTSTSHMSLVAANGDAVAVTSTINLHFGSKVMGSRTGILFNDEMDDFSSPNKTNAFGFPPTAENFIAPGKRPLSSMCPTVMVDKHGEARMVVGASGGSRIITSVLFTAVNTLYFGQNIKQAIDARRLHDQLMPAVLTYEVGFPLTIIQGLKDKGHNVTEVSLGKSVVQGIVRDGQFLYANCDFRKGAFRIQANNGQFTSAEILRMKDFEMGDPTLRKYATRIN